MLNNVEWGDYKIDALFEKCETNTLNLKTSELPSQQEGEYNLPALTAGIQNQGLNNYVTRKDATILKDVISISANGANTGATFFQSKEFTVLQDAYAIKWKDETTVLTEKKYLFLTSCISKAIYGNYEWTNKAGWQRIKDNTIKLPIKNGNIDFDFMEDYISELEARHISELEAYLRACGLDNYQLTEEENKLLNEFKYIDWKEYSISELFEIIPRKKRFDANKVRITTRSGYPYIVRTSQNNGLRGYIQEDKKFLNSANTIAFGQDTATAFYQKKPYFVGDKIKILKSKSKMFDGENALFFVTSITKSFSKFSWGESSFSEGIINKQKIKLPCTIENNNYEYMNKFIRIIKKLVIKDVVEYSKRKIIMTKKVLDKSIN